MSFLSVLKKIGSVALGIEHVAVPILATADPALAPELMAVDGWFTRTFKAVASAETLITAAKAGGLKQAAVVQDFQLGFQATQDALAVAGKTMEYDINQYKAVSDAFTAAYNAAAAFKATWKIVDLPQTPAPPQ